MYILHTYVCTSTSVPQYIETVCKRTYTLMTSREGETDSMVPLYSMKENVDDDVSLGETKKNILDKFAHEKYYRENFNAVGARIIAVTP